ncbi:unnamed protein product [Paramecium sonneborni]|uniref:Protein kinase domain-containing protein n=1 Tax=Paramecium sonneborni TaxID=65129 RepID=A0A8S1NGW5_9CILI|nr:unnamed protein product [Paramecium sonneborni]
MQQGNILIIDEYQIVHEELITNRLYECKSTKNIHIPLCARIIQMQEQHLRKYEEREQQIYEVILQYRNNQNLVYVHLIKKLEEQKKIVIIMEKCESNLQQLLERNKKFNDNEIEDFSKQFINGYSVLYNELIVHRNIKPDNIFIRYINGKPIYKIANFKIAKRMPNDNNIYLKKIGTPAYAAPEINTLNQDADLSFCFNSIKNIKNPKSLIDIFSIGMIFYQMVQGFLPFESNANQIKNFLIQIKQQPLKLQGNSKYVQIIEKLLIYFPGNRMEFESFIKYFKSESNQIFQFQISGINQIQQSYSNNFNFPQQSNVNLFRLTSNNNHNQQNNQVYQSQRMTQVSQFNPLVQNQQAFQINYNPRQKIIEFLIFLMHDYDGILYDSTKQQLQSFLELKDNIFSKEVLLELLTFINFKAEKIDGYDSKTLDFFYSIFSVLIYPDVQQLPKIPDQIKREYIKTSVIQR